MEQTTLYYRQGGSDKVYAAFIEPCQDGHIVRFQFGRRGTALKSGQKTAAPVSYADARKVYDKLIREKLSKGYQPGESQPAYRPPQQRLPPSRDSSSTAQRSGRSGSSATDPATGLLDAGEV